LQTEIINTERPTGTNRFHHIIAIMCWIMPIESITDNYMPTELSYQPHNSNMAYSAGN